MRLGDDDLSSVSTSGAEQERRVLSRQVELREDTILEVVFPDGRIVTLGAVVHRQRVRVRCVGPADLIARIRYPGGTEGARFDESPQGG
jgi:hypothetical protein